MINELDIQPDVVTDFLVKFIRDEVARAGFSRAVVGISGGLDSATSTFLAVRALGPGNVRGVIMPYKTSNPDSARHALKVIELTGIASETIEVTSMVDAYFATCPDADRTRRGNAMARQRMIVLYDKSAQYKALVIGTGNKTEALLGYTTLWGDMACGINPVGDLYKTQVRQLASYLGLPAEIIEKPPSADLWTGQTDEDELGFTYQEVDRFLYFAVDRKLTLAELVKMGFEESFVHRVLSRIELMEYKRRMPVVAKLSLARQG